MNYSNDKYADDPGPFADRVRASLNSGTTTGRFQVQEENLQAIPRALTLEEVRRAQAPLRGQEENLQAIPRAFTLGPLRGQTALLAYHDDDWITPHTDTPSLEEKAQKCLDLAKFLCQHIRGENREEVIKETAIDLMSIPVMNLERIHKRLIMDVVIVCLKILERCENDPPPKPLTRFQILKKE